MIASAQHDQIKVISSEALSRPAATYSHAVISGQLIFVAGQAGTDFSTSKVDSDFEKQARQAFNNLKQVLEASGSDMAHVVKTTIFLRNAEDFGILNSLYKEYFPVNPPARSVPVVNLPLADLKISIEAIAVKK